MHPLGLFPVLAPSAAGNVHDLNQHHMVCMVHASDFPCLPQVSESVLRPQGLFPVLDPSAAGAVHDLNQRHNVCMVHALDFPRLPQEAFKLFGTSACVSWPCCPFPSQLTVALHMLSAQEDGVTPLLLASHNGHLDVVKELLSKGAAVDKVTQVPCETGFMRLSLMHVHPTKQSGIQGISSRGHSLLGFHRTPVRVLCVCSHTCFWDWILFVALPQPFGPDCLMCYEPDRAFPECSFML